jgi:hypothetical protein
MKAFQNTNKKSELTKKRNNVGSKFGSLEYVTGTEGTVRDILLVES